MLKKIFFLLVCICLSSSSYTKDLSSIGVLIIKEPKDKQNIWSVLKPLIDLFNNEKIELIVLKFELQNLYFDPYSAISISQCVDLLKKKYNKKIISYSEDNLTHSAYMIAAATDCIMVSEGCKLGLIGCSMQLKDESKKISREGYTLNKIYVGKYKLLGNSSVETTNNDIQLTKKHTDLFYTEIINHLIHLRPILSLNKDKWIDGQIFALDKNQTNHFFVDKVGDRFALIKYCLELLGCKNITLKEILSCDLNSLNVNQPTAIKELNLIKSENNKKKIAILNVEELKLENSNFYFKTFHELLKNDEIIGIVLSLDSNGCNSTSTMINLNTEIKKLKRIYNKPLIGYINSASCSGGYWMAFTCDYIISSPIAEIGNVGTRWLTWDCTKANKMKNTEYHIISANKFGEILNENKKMTFEEKKMLKLLVSNLNKKFIKQLVQSRPNLKNNRKLWKDAQIYMAPEALQIGMIDQIGSPFDAIKYIDKDCDLKNIDLVFVDLALN